MAYEPDYAAGHDQELVKQLRALPDDVFYERYINEPPGPVKDAMHSESLRRNRIAWLKKPLAEHKRISQAKFSDHDS